VHYNACYFLERCNNSVIFGLVSQKLINIVQELEVEKLSKKKLEKELKLAAELAEEERNRQKHIVLLLLADRKKAIGKYIEERKRSEDLAQVCHRLVNFQ
jgi:hypothetical protein